MTNTNQLGARIGDVYPKPINTLGMSTKEREAILATQRKGWAMQMAAIKGHYAGMRTLPANVTNPLEEEQGDIVNTEYTNDGGELEPAGG